MRSKAALFALHAALSSAYLLFSIGLTHTFCPCHSESAGLRVEAESGTPGGHQCHCAAKPPHSASTAAKIGPACRCVHSGGLPQLSVLNNTFLYEASLQTLHSSPYKECVLVFPAVLGRVSWSFSASSSPPDSGFLFSSRAPPSAV